MSTAGCASMRVATRGRIVTGTTARASSPNAVAVSVAVPAPIALTLPFTSIDAIVVSLDAHRTDGSSAVQPLATVAVTCPWTPTSSVSVAGELLILRDGSMNPSHSSERPPEHAESTTLNSNGIVTLSKPGWLERARLGEAII